MATTEMTPNTTTEMITNIKTEMIPNIKTEVIPNIKTEMTYNSSTEMTYNDASNTMHNDTIKMTHEDTSEMTHYDTNEEMTHNDTSEMAHNDTIEMEHNDTTEMAHNDTIEMEHNDTTEMAHNDTTEMAHNDTSEMTHNDTSEMAQNDTTEMKHKAASELKPKVKERKPRCKTYTEEDLVNAITAVKDGMTKHQAARVWNVPRSTLNDACKEKYTFGKHSPGPSSFMPELLEKQLSDYILYMTEIGCGFHMNDIPPIAKSLLDHHEITSKFKENLPSLWWVKKFLSRNPNISLRPEARVKTAVKRESLSESYQDELKTIKTPKEKKKRIKTYTEGDLFNAITAIREGMTKHEAARIWNIPRSTLVDACKEKYTFGKHNPGPSSFMPEILEKQLSDFLQCMSEIGCVFQMNDVPAYAKNVLDYHKISTKFKDNLPSLWWVKRFLVRNPGFSLKPDPSICSTKIGVTRDSLAEWHRGLLYMFRNTFGEEKMNNLEARYNHNDSPSIEYTTSDEKLFLLYRKIRDVLDTQFPELGRSLEEIMIMHEKPELLVAEVNASSILKNEPEDMEEENVISLPSTSNSTDKSLLYRSLTKEDMNSPQYIPEQCYSPANNSLSMQESSVIDNPTIGPSPSPSIPTKQEMTSPLRVFQNILSQIDMSQNMYMNQK